GAKPRGEFRPSEPGPAPHPFRRRAMRRRHARATRHLEELIPMTRGGPRNRSGPAPDPSSGRSERRGFKLTALPSEGFRGNVPDFPLPLAVVVLESFEDKTKVRLLDEGASETRREREQDLWEWAWSTPQACAWSMEPWRWQAVAMWVRTSAICESPDAT